MLLKAWISLAEKYELVIIGDRVLEDEYLSFIKENKLKNMKIMRYKSKEEIKQYYKVADIFVLPTREDIRGISN